ncbi:MAG: type II secretion system secretin GspD [Methylovulum sp.]|uniref:type II secretion system secretin GspD n=1 Tax=Methylovulum sp. TaxID=1916980 RepID=UPI00260AA359|nr:type II secretion system secretin GspD [Methylovulum sp.]MDD2725151.1 type II secretion system secretin GspD [Methylovulum sp.]MDD5126400.1 type II secretion system secretin GspD [Methylovulum sp.]
MNNAKKILTTSCLLAMGLSLSSCELLAPKSTKLISLASEVKPTGNAKDAAVFKDLQNKPASDTVRPKAQIYPGTDRYIGTPAASWQSSPAGSGKQGTYDLNFDDADLGEVAKAVLSDSLGLNYVLSPKVAGKVTLQTTHPLTKDELLPTLEMVLRMNNAALVKDGNIYHIEPAGDALFTSEISTGGGKEGYQTRIIPVRNVAVDEMVEVIKPLVQEKTILNVDGTRNIIVASGTPDEMARVMDMVNTFDIDVLRGRSFGLFPLVHSDPESVIKELEEVFIGKGKAEDSEFFRFIPIERMNAVMAITHQGRYLQDIENWVLRLDKTNTASGGGVNVYKVQHADAEELADTLNEIFTGAQKQDRSAKVSPGQKATEISNKNPDSTKQDTKTASSSRKSKKDSSNRRSSGGSGGTATVANVDDVRIISDKTNNALIIVATPREYEVILPVIKQLDILPLQVLIDATIVSVKLTDKLKYGIQWFLDHQGSSISSGNGKEAFGSIAVAGAEAVASGGLSAMYNSGVVNALLSAQASKGNVNIISSPSLMVLNNQEAKINVGDQVPIQTSSTSVPIAGGSSGATLAQSNQIQYKDTGVTLEVTPRVNANGMVILEISQIVSSVVTDAPTTGVTTTATINKKEIESSVAVLDGETIVLGGLIDNNNTNNKGGIPWLHELPWIGPLFGNTTRENTKNELVVLITPRVVKSKQDSRLISQEFKRRLTGIYR